MMSITFFLHIILTLYLVNGECSYYATNAMDTCIEGKSNSKSFYCDDNGNIRQLQFGNGECTEPATYDQVLCNPDNDTNCVGNCGNDPCSYISMPSYGDSPCDKATDDWAEAQYIMDYCHSVSVSNANSFRWECSDIGMLSYTTYTDDSCTDPVSTITTAVEDLTETECTDAVYVSTECNVTVYDPTSNIGCPHHGSTPLDTCEGHASPSTNSSYAKRFTCDADGIMIWEAFANSNCSGNETYVIPLCDSRFSECYTRCSGDMCDYFVQRGYVGCDTEGDWNEVVRPIGYCVYESEGLSRIAECNSQGGLTYKQYTDGECQTLDFEVDIELSGYPSFFDGGCTHTYFYVNCPVPTTTAGISTTAMGTTVEATTTVIVQASASTEDTGETTTEGAEPSMTVNLDKACVYRLSISVVALFAVLYNV